MARGSELPCVANGGDKRGGGDRPNPRRRRQTLAGLVALVPSDDFGFDGPDTRCQIIKASKQLIDRCARDGR